MRFLAIIVAAWIGSLLALPALCLAVAALIGAHRRGMARLHRADRPIELWPVDLDEHLTGASSAEWALWESRARHPSGGAA